MTKTELIISLVLAVFGLGVIDAYFTHGAIAQMFQQVINAGLNEIGLFFLIFIDSLITVLGPIFSRIIIPVGGMILCLYFLFSFLVPEMVSGMKKAAPKKEPKKKGSAGH